MVITTFLIFTGLVALTTYLLTRKDDRATNTGYFLGGRSLGGVVIAGSLLLTNLSTEQMVGLNGDAYREGLSVMAWEIVAVLALVAMALFFLPRFLRSGVTTVPELLEKRFGHSTSVITTFIFLIAYAVILLPIILYTGAIGLEGMLDVKSLTGINSDTGVLVFMVVLVGCIGSVYALFGGLRSVAVSDTLNGAGLLVGGMLIVIFALMKVGGEEGILGAFDVLAEEHPEKLNSIGTESQSVPFGTLFTGVLLINMFYWTTNQQIIQRTLGAKSLREGQKGVLLCGTLKLLGPLYLVLPGILAYHLYADTDIRPDQSYGILVRDVLPPYLTGFFAAVMVGAILSSFNSALNSACTLFSLGVYKSILRPDAPDKQVVASGKIFGGILAIAAMIVAPILRGQESIFSYLQTMNAMYFIPILAVVIVAMTTARVPERAANTALITGLVVIALGYFMPIAWIDEQPFYFAGGVMNTFHFSGAVFAYLIVMMLVMGSVWPAEKPWQDAHSGDVEITPWPYALPTGISLVVIVFTIYLYFADFSVLA
ncbi:solute:sodium symporter family transporter [Mucisphaera calidilacus]|uniref:Putative symporter YidK n=1 Tax=Mucisphaera calidilacus TaxID=2527982 RepID=A0A518BZ33_9BACT|nr:solute:sodium symporter family transporter [Mucisphaera calidilacus]QDU72230.1 putative symporter YidK [Mucisphaera calidilacus]